LTVAFSAKGLHSATAGEVRIAALSAMNSAQDFLSEARIKKGGSQKQRIEKKSQFACFAGSLQACKYDNDCCTGSCVYLNICGGRCCYP
jgi:hypothetical protein